MKGNRKIKITCGPMLIIPESIIIMMGREINSTFCAKVKK